jgi:hypothetical protein
MRPNRVKTFDFSAGSLTASAGGNIQAYSDYPINGLLQSIQLKASTYAATGSLHLYVSGARDFALWNFISGTATSNVAVSGTYFPRVNPRYPTNVLMSGTSLTAYVELPLFGVLDLVGSGLGNGTSGIGLTITYI